MPQLIITATHSATAITYVSSQKRGNSGATLVSILGTNQGQSKLTFNETDYSEELPGPGVLSPGEVY